MRQPDQRQQSTSTAPEIHPDTKIRRARNQRRVGLVLLAAFLALGLAGLFGPKTSRVTAHSNGYELTVTYPSISRPGLPVRWEVLLKHPGGFQEKVRIAITFDYFHLFDVTGIEPESTSSSSDGKTIVFEFDPPSGDTFRMQFDASVEPGVHELPRATTSALVGGRPAVQVSFATRVVP